jgi:hypothetical protein
MEADTTLMAILTGGVWTKEATGVEGITRETAGTAFDTNGYLKPCALVRERDLVPDGVVRDLLAQVASATQTVEIYVYADAGAGYSAIQSAKARLYHLFEGYQFADSFEVMWSNSLGNLRELGALKNAAMSRIDFVVYEIHS